MNTDTIADLLTRIRNAITAKHRVLQVKYSRIAKDITTILHQQGYIKTYETQKEKGLQGTIKIGLKYDPKTKESAIKMLKRISKSGLRKYAKVNELPRVCNNLGIAIISTSKGVMIAKKARRKENHVGGEVLCYIF